MKRNVKFCLTILMLFCCIGCAQTVRRAGQVELFQIDDSNKLVKALSGEYPIKDNRQGPIAQFGDFARFPQDTITFQVHSLYLENLPPTFFGSTIGSNDVVLFADVWENAATTSYNAPSATSIVYIGKDQLVPGYLNFAGNIAFGPTTYKGHPLKIRFTVMVVQKQKGQEGANAVDIAAKYAELIPTYGAFANPIAGVMKDFLQSRPDVIAFDYEVTFAGFHLLSLENVSNLNRRSGSLLQAIGHGAKMPWLQYGFYALLETRKG